MSSRSPSPPPGWRTEGDAATTATRRPSFGKHHPHHHLHHTSLEGRLMVDMVQGEDGPDGNVRGDPLHLLKTQFLPFFLSHHHAEKRRRREDANQDVPGTGLGGRGGLHLLAFSLVGEQLRQSYESLVDTNGLGPLCGEDEEGADASDSSSSSGGGAKQDAGVLSARVVTVDWLESFFSSTSLAASRLGFLRAVQAKLPRTCSEDEAALAFAALTHAPLPAVAPAQNGEELLQLIGFVEATPAFQYIHKKWQSHCGSAEAPDSATPSLLTFFLLHDALTGCSRCFCLADKRGKGSAAVLQRLEAPLDRAAAIVDEVDAIRTLLAISSDARSPQQGVPPAMGEADTGVCRDSADEPQETRRAGSQDSKESTSTTSSSSPPPQEQQLAALREAVLAAEAELALTSREEDQLAVLITAVGVCQAHALHEQVLRFPCPGEHVGHRSSFRLSVHPSQQSGGEESKDADLVEEDEEEPPPPWRDASLLSQLRRSVSLLRQQSADLAQRLHTETDQAATRRCTDAACSAELARRLVEEERETLRVSEMARRSGVEADRLAQLSALQQEKHILCREERRADASSTPLPPLTGGAPVRVRGVPEDAAASSDYTELLATESELRRVRAELQSRQQEHKRLKDEVMQEEGRIAEDASARQEVINACETCVLALRDSVRGEEERRQQDAEESARVLAAVLRAVPLMTRHIGPTERQEKGQEEDGAQEAQHGAMTAAPFRTRACVLRGDGERTLPAASEHPSQWGGDEAVPSWSRLYISLVASRERAAGAVDGNGGGGSDGPSLEAIIRAAEMFCHAGCTYLHANARERPPRPLHEGEEEEAAAVVAHAQARRREELMERLCVCFLALYDLWQRCREGILMVGQRESELRSLAHKWTVVRRRVHDVAGQVEALKDVVEASDT